MGLIVAKNVSKIFRHRKPRTLLRDHVRDIASNANRGEGFYALRDVSFTIRAEESVALIGANGAGKSTMLCVVCGLAQPDEGTIEVKGSIAPLLELASGFHPDLTGKENLFLNAALLGMSEARTKERYQAILDFSGIAEFIEEPLRTYSSGMMVRLAFSIATECDPAIVIVDEVLGVGDAAFQQQCYQRIMDLRAMGKTLLCVSHGTGTVKQFCDRAIWLHHGQVVADGPANDVVDEYSRFMLDPHQPAPASPATPAGLPERVEARPSGPAKRKHRR